MLVKYKGSRTWFSISFNRKSYNFSVENNRTVDIEDPKVVNYIFSLPNSNEFEVVQEVQPETKKIEKESVTFDGKDDVVDLKPKPKKKKKKSKKRRK